MKSNKINFLLLLVCLTLYSQRSEAQNNIISSIFGSGGGVVADSNNRIVSTVGQTAIGVASSANYISRVGVWYQFVDVITSVAQSESDVIPKEFRLDQNYPNPFNPATTIQFALPKVSQVKLKLFDILGREVATLVDEELEPGEYKVVFEAKGLTSGVYIL